MLTPERKRHIADGSEYIASLLHEEIVKIVSEAIVTRMERGVEYRLTARDRWMLELLQDAGYMREALEKKIADKTRLMLQEVQAAFEDAAVESVAWDNEVYQAAGLEPLPLRQSPALMRLAERGYQKTKGELVNFTGTLANTSQQLFIRECDKAYTLVASGAMSHARAVRQAVETAAGDGIIVRYPSGHRDTIETATGRAVRTGVGQACGDMTLARMDELDWDIVLVSSHLGARTGDGGDNWTNHYYLQSLGFFSRSGNDKRFKALSVCGIGYVDGLLGANCRHSIGPGDGVHNPYAHYDSEANRLREERDTRMRLLERRIRASRREVLALQEAVEKAPDDAVRAEAEAAHRRKAKVLLRQEKAYDDFCQENHTRKLYDRLQVAQYGAKQARAAEKAAGKSLANAGKSGILNTVGEEPIAITNEAIEKVPLVKPSGWSDEQAKNLQSAHKELLRYAQKEPVGTECGFLLDMNGKAVSRKVGGNLEIKMPELHSEHILIHNHPNNETFSRGDIESFLWRGDTQGMTALGNDGATVHGLFKTDQFDGYKASMALYKRSAELNKAEEAVKKAADVDSLDPYFSLIEQLIEELKGYGIEVI